MTVHETVPLQVWADVDEGISGLVRYLNTIPGVRTHSSCQGEATGPKPYGPHVLCSWSTPQALWRLTREFGDHFTIVGDGHWGYVHPEDTSWDLGDLKEVWSWFYGSRLLNGSLCLNVNEYAEAGTRTYNLTLLIRTFSLTMSLERRRRGIVK